MSKIVKEGEVIYSKLAVINYMLNFKSKFSIFFMGSQQPILNSDPMNYFTIFDFVLIWSKRFLIENQNEQRIGGLFILPKKDNLQVSVFET